MSGRDNPEENGGGFEIVPSESRELAHRKACTCHACGAVFNREKVFCPACGLSIQQAQPPAEYGGYPIEHGITRADRSARIFALLSLILGIAGPLALGIGWLLAIIFGFTALNLFRMRGDFSRDRRLAYWGISLGFFWPVAGFLAASLLSYNITSERIIRRNERAVESLLTDAAVAQRFIKHGYFLDEGAGRRYAGPADFREIEHRLVPEDLPEFYMGYDVHMSIDPEGGFSVSASPERYGRTGRKSFHINETGILRGGDAGAAGSFAQRQALPDIRGKSVYEDYDNLIAENLVALARRLASAGEFRRAERILAGIRSEFYMMPAAAGVEEAEKSLGKHAYEHEARTLHRRAVSLIEEGRLRDALAVLRNLERDYAESEVMSEAASAKASAERKLLAEHQEEAEKIFNEARELEREGRYAEAVELYRKIQKEFESVSIHERAAGLAGSVEARRLERNAEEIFSRISGLNLEESYAEAIDAVNSLLNHYPETATVKNNESRLRNILNTAAGERGKNNAVTAFQQGNFDAAIQSAESAVRANPALRGQLLPLLRHSYLNKAEGFYGNQAYDRAIQYYENWMNITDYEDRPEYLNYHYALYEHAKNKFAEGQYAEAVKILERTGNRFAGSGEYWHILGAGALLEKNYPVAVTMLRRSVAIDDGNPGAWLKKALCKMHLVQQKEDELKELLGGLSGLKRGADLFFEINSLVNALNSKDLEIKQLASATGGGEAGERRRARLPAERDAFEADTRARMFAFQERIRRNNDLRGRITVIANSLHESYNEINSHLMKTPSGYGGRGRDEFERIFRRKRRHFAGLLELERGLNQEMRLEENAILNLEFSLTKFGQERSFEQELRTMYRLREDIARMRMQRQIEEGYAQILRAIDLKIPVEEQIASLLAANPM